MLALGVDLEANGEDEAAAAAATTAFGLKDEGAGADASGDDEVLSADLAALANTSDSRILSLSRRSRRAPPLPTPLPLPSLPPVAASTPPFESNPESGTGTATETGENPAAGDEADKGADDEVADAAEADADADEAVAAAAAGGTRGRNGFVRTRKAAIRRAAPRRLIHSGGKSQRPG